MAYVYRHIRLDKNVPFYIGIGSDSDYKRAYQLKNSRRNPIWNKIISKTDIEIEILIDNLTYEEAILKEIEFINLYGRLNINTGTLSNLTYGGEGTKGLIVKEETKNKLSQRFTGIGNPMYGKKLSKESIEKGRLKRLGKTAWNKGKKNIYSDELLKKMSDSKKGIFVGEKNGMFGKKHSEQSKAKMSENKRGKIAWNVGKKGVNGISNAKIVLNLENGIFYNSCKEASLIYDIKHSTLKSKLNGRMKNNTLLIYAPY
jgi:hypothetical protein